MLLACCATFLFTSSMFARLGVGAGGGLLVMVGSGGIGAMAAKAPMLDSAAVMVAAVILAIAAFIGMFGIAGIPCIPIGMFMGKLGIGRGSGKDRGGGVGVGKGNWRIALGLRLSGMGTPALAHIAAALALAISNNWSLSSSVRRGGVLLALRRVLEVDLLLRRIRMGEWLGSRFHRSRLSKEWPRNTGLLRPERDTERDLLDREWRALERDRDLLFLVGDRDFERLLFSRLFDLFRRAGERDLDRLFRTGDLDLERFLLGDLDFERLALVWDLDLDFSLCGIDLERDFLRRAGDLDVDLFLWLCEEDLDLRFLVGVLDFSLTDFDLDRGLWVEEADLERFLRIGDLDTLLGFNPNFFLAGLGVRDIELSDCSLLSDPELPSWAKGSDEVDLDLDVFCIPVPSRVLGDSLLELLINSRCVCSKFSFEVFFGDGDLSSSGFHLSVGATWDIMAASSLSDAGNSL